MNVILAAIALLFERFFDWSHFRRWFNFRIYLEWIQKYSFRDELSCMAWILPLPVLTALVLYLTSFFLFGVPTAILKLLIFMYCLGPQNFWVDSMAARAALQQNDPLLPDIWNRAFGISAAEIASGQGNAETAMTLLITASVRAAYARLFAPLIGFLLFGAVGAVFYRVLCLSFEYAKQSQASTRLQWVLQTSLQWIDAIPLRLMALFFLIFSDKAARVVFREKCLWPPREQSALLQEMALLCIKKQSEKMQLAEDAVLQVLRKILDWVFALTLSLGLLMYLI